MKPFNFFKIGLVASAIALSGCSGLSNMYSGMEKSISDYQFEQRIQESRMLIREANAYLIEGNIVSAKASLDEAYTIYPRQASLHDSYREYYKYLGNEELVKLASARFDKMVETSNVLNAKGRYAMTKLENMDVAGDLFNLSLIYHDKNTATLVNIATLAYTTDDMQLASSSLRMLNALGHQSPESSMLEYLVAERQGDTQTKMIVRMIMKNEWPNSAQYKFIQSGGLSAKA